jgi:hypothetical protein
MNLCAPPSAVTPKTVKGKKPGVVGVPRMVPRPPGASRMPGGRVSGSARKFA